MHVFLIQVPVNPACLNPDAEVWTSSNLSLDISGPAYLQPEQLWEQFSDVLNNQEGNTCLRSHHTLSFTLNMVCQIPVCVCVCLGYVPEFNLQNTPLTEAVTQTEAAALTDGEAQSEADPRALTPGALTVCVECSEPAVSGIGPTSQTSLSLVAGSNHVLKGSTVVSEETRQQLRTVLESCLTR